MHTTERHASNRAETGHGRPKAWLRPMRGLRRHRSARILAADPDARHADSGDIDDWGHQATLRPPRQVDGQTGEQLLTLAKIMGSRDNELPPSSMRSAMSAAVEDSRPSERSARV
jgi:hypothetical protein